MIDHHRTGEAKQSSRPRPRISFELGRPRGSSSGGGLTVITRMKPRENRNQESASEISEERARTQFIIASKVSSAPKISKRKKFVPKDIDDDGDDRRSYKKSSAAGSDDFTGKG